MERIWVSACIEPQELSNLNYRLIIIKSNGLKLYKVGIITYIILCNYSCNFTVEVFSQYVVTFEKWRTGKQFILEDVK
jgi:hypothetical protein